MLDNLPTDSTNKIGEIGQTSTSNEYTVTEAHQKHIQDILDEVNKLLPAKYANGVLEHGGRLWENPHIADEIVNEAIDLLVHAITLRNQLKYTRNVLDRLNI